MPDLKCLQLYSLYSFGLYNLTSLSESLSFQNPLFEVTERLFLNLCFILSCLIVPQTKLSVHDWAHRQKPEVTVPLSESILNISVSFTANNTLENLLLELLLAWDLHPIAEHFQLCLFKSVKSQMLWFLTQIEVFEDRLESFENEFPVIMSIAWLLELLFDLCDHHILFHHVETVHKNMLLPDFLHRFQQFLTVIVFTKDRPCLQQSVSTLVANKCPYQVCLHKLSPPLVKVSAQQRGPLSHRNSLLDVSVRLPLVSEPLKYLENPSLFLKR